MPSTPMLTHAWSGQGSSPSDYWTKKDKAVGVILPRGRNAPSGYFFAKIHKLWTIALKRGLELVPAVEAGGMRW